MKRTNTFITKRYSKWFLKTVAVCMITVLMLSLVSCKGHSDEGEPGPEDQFAEDEPGLYGLQEKKKSISLPSESSFESIIRDYDSSKEYPEGWYVEPWERGGYVSYQVYGEIRPGDISYDVYTNESDARSQFEKELNKFKTDAYDDVYSGIVEYSLGKDNGYITFNASGTNGEFFKQGANRYGGIYYSGNSILYFLTGGSYSEYKNSELDRIDILLDSLGLPKPQR